MDASSIPTAFPSLDKTLGGGLRTGDLIVLGGDAGSGTSSLSLAIALKAAEQGTPILRVHDVPETVQALKIWRGLRDQGLSG